jgi:hypothetical protein
MGTYVITDPRGDLIYGTVRALDVFNAGAAVRRGDLAVDWFYDRQPGPEVAIRVDLADDLADGRWREAAPGVPLPEGDVGGDYQVSEALGRRWWLRCPDGLWAMYGVAWYVSDDTDQVDEPVGPRLERQVELLVCPDIQDPGSESWADYRYEVEEGWAAEEASVVLAVRDFDPDAEIDWDGEEGS